MSRPAEPSGAYGPGRKVRKLLLLLLLLVLPPSLSAPVIVYEERRDQETTPTPLPHNCQSIRPGDRQEHARMLATWYYHLRGPTCLVVESTSRG